ncbi:MAG: ComF family protein [Cyclobacteriaceae bacterium]
MKLWSIIKEYLQDFVDMVYPRVCLGCDTILLYQEEHICMRCKFSLPKTNYHTRKPNRLDQKFVFEPKVMAVAAYLHYNKKGIARKLIGELKYKGVQEVGSMLGYWFANDLKAAEWPVDLIIPVPLHVSKLKRRGFNQSEIIANGLAENLKVPVVTDVVSRVKNTNTQTRKNKVERWQNMDMVYSVQNTTLIKGKNVLVVDDVLTTGATMGQLVESLAKEGVAGIYIATLAAGQ